MTVLLQTHKMKLFRFKLFISVKCYVQNHNATID